MIKPYIGATGVVTKEDVESAKAFAARVRRGAKTHRPMIGILASAKTLAGEPTSNRRYPGIDAIRWLLLDLGTDESIFRTIHYNTRRADPLDEQVEMLFSKTGRPDGIQLNIARPDPAAVERVSRAWGDVEIILQINGASLGKDRSAGEAGRYAALYNGSVNHALLDLSGGDGKSLDIDWCCEAVHAVREALPMAVVGVAGGLGPDCSETLGRIVRRIGGTRISVDAEGRLRLQVSDPIEGEPYQDELSPDMLLAYGKAASDALGHHRAIR